MARFSPPYSMRVVVAIAITTLLHAALSVGVFLLSFTQGMARFETGAGSTWNGQALYATSAVLYFPFMQLAQLAPRDWFPGLLGYVPVLLNSFFWAVLLVCAWQQLHRRRV